MPRGNQIKVRILTSVHSPFDTRIFYKESNSPSSSAQAREESLKLITNIPLRYSYSFLRSAFSPLLVVLLAMLIVQSFKNKLMIRCGIALIILIAVMMLVSVSGARAPAASLILTIILAFFLKKGMLIRPFYIILAIIVVLSIPVLFSIFREGQELSPLHFVQYLTGGHFW